MRHYPIKLMKRYSPSDCRANPKFIFVYGDNLGMKKNGQQGLRYGKAGQACIRDEPNAIGIATKLAPSMEEWAFFTDSEKHIEMAKNEFDTTFSFLQSHVETTTIVWPEDGIGTGLAELVTRAPEIWAMLDRHRAILFAYGVEGN